jgi:hypothetical protein
LLIPYLILSQDSVGINKKEVKKKWELNGYIKNLELLTFNKDFKDNISSNLLHNRLNIKWKPSDRLTAVTEFRNRVIWGEEVKLTHNYASLLRNDNEWLNLQMIWIDNPSLVLHTNTERLYVDYHTTKWNVRAGRQRINWGITTTWSPNDIFNTYNFLDFDYEERPGADGAKLQYLLSDFSNIEVAYSNKGKHKGSVAALRYSLNKWGYDIQLITGRYSNHPTIGFGWAGSIKDAGFKGEMQYFIASKDSVSVVNISTQLDYMFENGWYVNVGFLFASNGLNNGVNDWYKVNFKFTPEHLMPTKWNGMITTSKKFTPLFTATISTLYAPGANLLILFPMLQYSIVTNLDVNLVWQSFFSEVQHTFQAVSHQAYVRMKWSF